MDLIFIMRKNTFGRRLKRDINQRKALFKSLMSSLVLKEKIKTTEAKAKAIRGEVDKLITKGRKEEKLARRLLSSLLTPKAIEKLLLEIVPRFKMRQGGYTRIVKIGQRLSDGARIVLMEWVEESAISLPAQLSGSSERKRNIRPLKKSVSQTSAKSLKEARPKRTVNRSTRVQAHKKSEKTK